MKTPCLPHFFATRPRLEGSASRNTRAIHALKFYTERDWPKCDVIVSNPPFLGDKLMRGELGDEYVEELRRIFSEQAIPGQSDFCCYWFEKARELNCQRANANGPACWRRKEFAAEQTAKFSSASKKRRHFLCESDRLDSGFSCDGGEMFTLSMRLVSTRKLDFERTCRF
jgi:hypothetical protein